MRGEELKGHIDTIVLAALADEPAHGYALVTRVRSRSGEALDVGEGTIYPALHRLERDGLIESAWEQATGRRRRVYAITGAGSAQLGERRADWKTFARGMQALLEGGGT
jgi:DNA-binding PadR family transcriptional regulator